MQAKAKPEPPMSRTQFWFFHPFRVRHSEIDGQDLIATREHLL
jgi:acyl-CoA thioester hydrolase